MESRELLGGEDNLSSCPQDKAKRQEVGREWGQYRREVLGS